jgi:stage V sporulation protein AE
MDYVIAFLTGGAICGISQLVMDKTKLMPGRVMVILVCLGAALGAMGVYQPFADWAKAGATVPLIGFGNTLFQGMKKAIDEHGFLGIFEGGFTSCAVGVSAALVFGYIGSWIFKPKTKV